MSPKRYSRIDGKYNKCLCSGHCSLCLSFESSLGSVDTALGGVLAPLGNGTRVTLVNGVETAVFDRLAQADLLGVASFVIQ